jgi:TrmH family RNA methyltransferase
MGTLIRSAIAMGIKSVVIVEGTDPWSPKVIQASAGTIIQANVFQIGWDQLIKNKKNLKLCALVVKGGKKPNQIDFKDILLVVGNEANGIPDNWLSKCEEKMTLPMPGNTESLNAAIAGSIALYLAFAKK